MMYFYDLFLMCYFLFVYHSEHRQVAKTKELKKGTKHFKRICLQPIVTFLPELIFNKSGKYSTIRQGETMHCPCYGNTKHAFVNR